MSYLLLSCACCIVHLTCKLKNLCPRERCVVLAELCGWWFSYEKVIWNEILVEEGIRKRKMLLIPLFLRVS